MGEVIVAIGIVLRQGRILICQRKAEGPLGGNWEFPGGKCEPGESPEQCLRRELLEELGIEVQIIEPLAPIHHEYPHARVCLRPYLCQHVAHEPAPLACARIDRVTPEQLSDYRFPPANDDLLRELVRRFGKQLEKDQESSGAADQ